MFLLCIVTNFQRIDLNSPSPSGTELQDTAFRNLHPDPSSNLLLTIQKFILNIKSDHVTAHLVTIPLAPLYLQNKDKMFSVSIGNIFTELKKIKLVKGAHKMVESGEGREHKCKYQGKVCHFEKVEVQLKYEERLCT